MAPQVRYSHLKMKVLQVLLTLISLGVSAPIKNQNTEAQYKNAAKWLEKFGYVDSGFLDGEVLSDDTVTAALMKMQRYANLKVTGVLDEATVNKMSSRRCGLPDKSSNRQKRYSLSPYTWEAGRVLDVEFVNYTSDMPLADQEAVIADVVNQWNAAAATNLLFHPHGQLTGDAEIVIHHSDYYHDGLPFASGTLAYAYYPRRGEIFFADTELWSKLANLDLEVSYKAVALHELGHAIGLEHSEDPSAVMYAYYDKNKLTLSSDDVSAAVNLFGPA